MQELRFKKFLSVMSDERLSAVALVPGANFRRTFGWDFHQHERPLVVIGTADLRAVAIVPHLEAAAFAKLGFQGEVFTWRDEVGFDTAFLAAATTIGPLNRIGVEGQRMRVFDCFALSRAFQGATLVDAHGAISQSRLVKTSDEMALLQRAVRISEDALDATLQRVRVGMTEREVESILLGNLFAAGAEGLSFAPTVAAGANSAQPHAKARSDYRIATGDALLLDFGATVEGYHADITRTVFVGGAASEDREFYATVLRANAAGRAAVRPGLPAGDLDDIVLKVLEQSPFGRFTRHKTGHGLGLEVHEDPYIMRGNQAVLLPGMVFTIEPGLYVLGKIGVRIEDNVVVSECGCDVLTSFSRDLQIVG